MSEVRERTTRELADVLLTVRPDRARRCTGCQVTHVVSTPACCRAAPTVPPRSARCWSQPPAGAGTGSSPTSSPSRTAVRGWIRRARASARHLWAMGVQAVVTLDPDALPAQFRPDPLASALGVLGAAAMALATGSPCRTPARGPGSPC